VNVLQDEPVSDRRGRRRTEQLDEVDPNRLDTCPSRGGRFFGALDLHLAIREPLVRNRQAGAHFEISSPAPMPFDPLRRAARFAGRELPWQQPMPRYRLNVVDLHSFAFRKLLALPQPLTVAVVMVSAAAFGAETAGYEAIRKRTTEGAVVKNHVMLAQIVDHRFPDRSWFAPVVRHPPPMNGVLHAVAPSVPGK
jgi:hypothetical protein